MGDFYAHFMLDAAGGKLEIYIELRQVSCLLQTIHVKSSAELVEMCEKVSVFASTSTPYMRGDREQYQCGLAWIE